jgi:hypothetical protein
MKLTIKLMPKCSAAPALRLFEDMETPKIIVIILAKGKEIIE